jgi:hypothetical protein
LARLKLGYAVLAAAISFAAGGAVAQEAAPKPALSLELNGVQQSQKGCRLTFVVANRLGADLSKAAFEIALFDQAGVVDTLTVLDFKELPAEKTKVTRFDLPGLECTKISRVLVNRATECVGEGIEPSACMRQLAPSTRSKIVFGV